MSAKGYNEVSVDYQDLIIAGMNFMMRSGKITETAKGSLDKIERVENQIKKVKFSDVENGSYLNTDAEYPTTTTQTGHAFKENDIKCDGYNTQRFQDTACVSCMQENGVDNIYQETQMKEVPIIYVFLQKCSNRSPTHIACTGREGGEL